MSTLRLRGCEMFRYRLVCATMAGRPLRIDDIRSDDQEPGIRDFEASFLRLLEKLTNGTEIQINETGTVLRYRPGIVTGGRIEHDCGNSRSIGWFLEAILPICVFAKSNVVLSLTGITNDDVDLSVDIFKNVTFPLLQHLGVENVQMRVKQRGAPPNGGGLVELVIPVCRELRPLNYVDMGLVKRIRGVAFCTKVSPTIATRVVESARGVLNRFIPDVFIFTDHYKGKEGGASAGYSLSLVSESTTGVLLSVERTAATGGAGGELPEDVGREGAVMLIDEIAQGGCVDRSHQCLMILLMTLSPEDVTKIRIGSLTDASIKMLRLVQQVFGTTFKIRPDEETRTVLLSCLGTGYKNLNRRVT